MEASVPWMPRWGNDGEQSSGRKWQAWQMTGGLHRRSAAKEDWETWLFKIPQGISAVTYDTVQWKMSQVGTARGIYRSSLRKLSAPRFWEGEWSMMTEERHLWKLSGQSVYSWEGWRFGGKWSRWVAVTGEAYASYTVIVYMYVTGVWLMCTWHWVLLSCPGKAKNCVGATEV